MTIVGNIDFKSIENRQYLTTETTHAQEIISKLTQENIPFSGRYDDTKLTLNFSQKDWEKVNQILQYTSAPEPAKTEPETPEQGKAQDYDTLAKRSLEELQQQMQQLEQELRSQQKAAEEQEKAKQERTQTQQSASYTDKAQETVTPEKLLPILSTKVVQHTGKLEALAEKRAVLQDKISNNQAKIAALTTWAERLSDTNHMMQTLSQQTKIPGLRTLAESVIRRNERKIVKIQKDKIPVHQAKIKKHTDKITAIDRKSAVTMCKLKRCHSMNKLIKSFGILDNAERRQQFAQAMDGLHQATSQTLTFKAERCAQKITTLSQKYMETDSAADKLRIHQKINAQKERKQKITAKLDKLHGVTKPYTKQSDPILDNILSKTKRQLKEAAETGKAEIPILAEQVCVSNTDFLPEVAIATPEKSPDQSLMPEIAGILHMSVSEIESKPQDIQQMLKDMYIANYFSDPATLQQTLTAIINPNHETQRDLQSHQAETETPIAASAKEADSDSRKHQQAQELSLAETAVAENTTVKNPLRPVEELTEQNANMIDGIRNNEKPKQQPEREAPKKAGFSFSSSSIKAMAEKVRETPPRPPEPERHRNQLQQ